MDTNHALGRVYADGELIVRQGEAGDCMFTLQDGRLEVLVHQEGHEDKRVSIMEKGAIFGEMAIFEREVRSATVRALGTARVLTIDKKTFLRRVQADPSIAFNLARLLCNRIRKLSAELAGLKIGDVVGVTLVAKDGAGQSGASQTRYVFVSPHSVAASDYARMSDLQRSLDATRAMAKELGSAVQSLDQLAAQRFSGAPRRSCASARASCARSSTRA